MRKCQCGRNITIGRPMIEGVTRLTAYLAPEHISTAKQISLDLKNTAGGTGAATLSRGVKEALDRFEGLEFDWAENQLTRPIPESYSEKYTNNFEKKYLSLTKDHIKLAGMIGDKDGQSHGAISRGVRIAIESYAFKNI